jgi:hypothetical protein
VTLTNLTTPRFDVLEEVGVVKLPRTGRIIKVRVMGAPDGTGPAIDVREFMLDEFWLRIREAQARAALTGKKIKGPTRAQQLTGPLRKGWWLQPHAAEELAELLALGVVNAEAIAAEAALRRREGGEGQELCMPERKVLDPAGIRYRWNRSKLESR